MIPRVLTCSVCGDVVQRSVNFNLPIGISIDGGRNREVTTSSEDELSSSKKEEGSMCLYSDSGHKSQVIMEIMSEDGRDRR
jgi:hypothetical protein